MTARSETLVRQHLPIVWRQARILAGRLPGDVDRRELVAAGTFGLMEAARRFDVTAGASFETFATYRVRGAMLDEMRKAAPLTRAEHERSLDGDAPFVVPRVVFDSLLVDRRAPLDVPDFGDPLFSRRVRAAIARLPVRLRRLIVWRFWEGLLFAQIAPRLGLKESRVSQLEKVALERLRAELRISVAREGH